jgi:hypothetical protein
VLERKEAQLAVDIERRVVKGCGDGAYS